MNCMLAIYYYDYSLRIIIRLSKLFSLFEGYNINPKRRDIYKFRLANRKRLYIFFKYLSLSYCLRKKKSVTIFSYYFHNNEL